MTIAQINKFLADNGAQSELVKGKGYYYFSGKETNRWPSTSVMVNRLNQLSKQEWLAEYRSLKREAEMKSSAKCPHCRFGLRASTYRFLVLPMKSKPNHKPETVEVQATNDRDAAKKLGEKVGEQIQIQNLAEGRVFAGKLAIYRPI